MLGWVGLLRPDAQAHERPLNQMSEGVSLLYFLVYYFTGVAGLELANRRPNSRVRIYSMSRQSVSQIDQLDCPSSSPI